MPELVKAKLTEISADPQNPRDLSEPMEVQFNPTTLKLALSNQAEGGTSQTRPQRQYLGSGSRTLTLDLVFDTADEGETGAPRSVRDKTALVERFALPRAQGTDKQAPPKARFEWGPLVVEGIVEGVSIDLDHFAADGTPLRAKVALTIKEQDASFELLESGAGANPAGAAPPPGGGQSGRPGTSGSGSDRVGTALGGESAADFAVRMGLDPGAWRGLSAGLDATLSLQAGLEIGFSASLGAGLGVGVSLGVSAGISTSISASFGLGADLNLGAGLSAGGQFGGALSLGGGGLGASQAGIQAGVQAGVQAGTALAGSALGGPALGGPAAGGPATAGLRLSAAGGVGPAIEAVKGAIAQASQGAAKAAFSDPRAPATAVAANGGVPRAAATAAGRAGVTATATPMAAGTAPAPVRPAMAQQPRPPLSRTGLPAPGAQAAPAPPPPKADPRATSFGFGVPLRPTYGEAARTRAQGALGLPPTTDDPQVPRWRELPAAPRRSVPAPADPKTTGCRCACPQPGGRGGR